MDTINHATQLAEQAHDLRDKIQGEYILFLFSFIHVKESFMLLTTVKIMANVSVYYVPRPVVRVL